eukprot:scaffold12.g7969.t1
MCAALAEFVAQQGSLPKRGEAFQHGSWELRLGQWLAERRKEERKGKIAPQLKAAIEAAAGPQLAGGLWAVREVNRSALCSALAAFVEQHGSLPKQRETFQHGGCELRLGKWLHSRRQEERNGKLAPQLKAAIETAAGAELAGTLWERQRLDLPAAEQCAALAEFVAQHSRLPKQLDTFQHGCHEAPLGRWLTHRRQDERRGRLALHLKAAIEAAAGAELAGALWEAQILPAAHWCSALGAFVAQHGRLPKTVETFQHGGRELRLGPWLHNLRQDERKGKLAPQLKAAIQAAAGAALAGTLWGVQKLGTQPPPHARPCGNKCGRLSRQRASHGGPAMAAALSVAVKFSKRANTTGV